MRTIVLPVLLTTSLLLASTYSLAAQEGQAAPAAAPAPAQTAEPTPAPTAAPAKAAGPSTKRSDAAEARYREWVDTEHAKDAVEFAKDKSKIENKYKGYVRPKREKKDGKAAPADQPAKP
ncbi:MAG: hypothetical protein ACLGQH_10215 [Acidobacteriota bacterium]